MSDCYSVAVDISAQIFRWRVAFDYRMLVTPRIPGRLLRNFNSPAQYLDYCKQAGREPEARFLTDVHLELAEKTRLKTNRPYFARATMEAGEGR